MQLCDACMVDILQIVSFQIEINYLNTSGPEGVQMTDIFEYWKYDRGYSLDC